jgi:hypothetical protein
MSLLDVDVKHYHNCYRDLVNDVKQQGDYVFLVNVLHEISPTKWVPLFRKISKLLKPDGELIIIEQVELTVGEKAYCNGFTVLTEKAALLLFNCDSSTLTPLYDDKRRNIALRVPSNRLCISKNSILRCLLSIREESIIAIRRIRSDKDSKTDSYRKGLSLAFWEHQNANAILNIEDFESK